MKKSDSSSGIPEDDSGVTKVGKLLSGLGMSDKSGNKIKFGGGVSGRMTSVTITVITGISGIGLAIHAIWYAAVGLAFLAFLAFIYGMEKINSFADKHPELATLDGLEVIAYREQEIQLTSKGLDHPIPITILEADLKQPLPTDTALLPTSAMTDKNN